MPTVEIHAGVNEQDQPEYFKYVQDIKIIVIQTGITVPFLKKSREAQTSIPQVNKIWLSKSKWTLNLLKGTITLLYSKQYL